MNLEQEFKDYSDCYKYELLEQRLVDFYSGTIAPLHITEYPEFVQKLIKISALDLAERKIEEIKNSDVTMLSKLAQNAWLDELEKVERN